MSSRRPLAFFALVFALSIPFLVVGAVTRLELLPGLPVAALMIFAPLAAAVMLVYREEGPAGVATLRRAIDFGRIWPAWYLPIVLLMPGVALVSYGVMRWMRIPVPEPEIPLAGAVGMALAFFAAALAEEVGWSGYATDPLQARWGALLIVSAAAIVIILWAPRTLQNVPHASGA